MLNKINKISNFLLPLVIIFAVFSVGGFKWGMIASFLMLVFAVFKFLPDIYVYLAMFNYKKNNDKTFMYLERAYNTGKMKPDYILYYAYLCLREGMLERSERLINVVLAKKGNEQTRISAKINLALLTWKKGNLDEAIRILEEVGTYAKNSVYYGNLGYFLLLRGEYAKALEFNLEAYEFNSDDMIILDNLAQSYYYMGSYRKSEEVYEELMKQNPQFPVPHYNYAKTLYALGKREEAAQHARYALSFPFNHLAGASSEEVSSFLENVENELGGAK